MKNIESKRIKPKRGVLELAKQLGSVSAACKTMRCTAGECEAITESGLFALQ